MLGSALSNQTGAAVGALAFPVLGPVGVVAIRQWVAGVILMSAGRPRLRSFTRAQWIRVGALAAVYAVMNLTVYTAIDRVGLGLAVTLEFLGPLTVALVSGLRATPAGARRRIMLVAMLFAAAGVLILSRPQASADYLGIAIGLVSAACWGSYILLNRSLGTHFDGLQGSAAAGLLSALAYVPVGIIILAMHPVTVTALALGAVAGLLSSAVPFIADISALRRVPAHFFGVFMSVNPVFAAAIGAAVLGQLLGVLDWVGIAVIVAANIAAVLASVPTRPAAGSAGEPAQELTGPVVARIGENLLGRTGFDNPAAVQETHGVGNFAGERDLVGRHHDGATC